MRRDKIDWRRGFTELAVIVLGVLIALWAENWRQSLQDRSLEREYVERLGADLHRDTTAIVEMTDLAVAPARYVEVVLQAYATRPIAAD